MENIERQDAIGMARPYKAHQQVMSYLFAFLLSECDTDEYRILTEEPISPDRDDKTPDILIEEKESGDLVLIIEICRSLEEEEHIAEYQRRCPRAEIFVVDYVKREWYSFGANADSEDPSYSEFLDEDLDDAIDWDDIEQLEQERLACAEKKKKEKCKTY